MIKRLDELEARIDILHDESIRSIYDEILEMGSDAFKKDSLLYRHKNSGLLERMTEHFIKTEDFEKCSVLQKWIWRLKGVI